MLNNLKSLLFLQVWNKLTHKIKQLRYVQIIEYRRQFGLMCFIISKLARIVMFQ